MYLIRVIRRTLALLSLASTAVEAPVSAVAAERAGPARREEAGVGPTAALSLDARRDPDKGCRVGHDGGRLILEGNWVLKIRHF